LVRGSWPDPIPDRLTPVTGSLEDQASLAQLVEGATVVIHVAGAIRARKDSDFQRINVDGTRYLAESASAAATKPYFLHISSLAARAPEVSAYAASKRASEDAVAENASGLEWMALRPPAVYGPEDQATLSIFRPISKGIGPVLGTPDARVSLIFVDDLVAAVAAILQDPPPSGSVFEISDGAPEGYSWRQIGETAARSLGKSIFYLRIPRLIMQIAAAANSVISRLFGIAPIMTQGKVQELYHPDWACRGNPLAKCTSWQPKVGIEEGFSRTLAWYRDHGWI
jgi:2-alkyl-3-oxoalkanoate reductase